MFQSRSLNIQRRSSRPERLEIAHGQARERGSAGSRKCREMFSGSGELATAAKREAGRRYMNKKS